MFKKIRNSFEISLFILALFFGFFLVDSFNEEVLIALFLILMFRLIYLYTSKLASFFFLSKIEKLYVYFLYLIRLSINLSLDVLKSLNFITFQFNLFIIPYLYKFVSDFIKILRNFELNYHFLITRNIITNWISFSLMSGPLFEIRLKIASAFFFQYLNTFIFVRRLERFFFNSSFIKGPSKFY